MVLSFLFKSFIVEISKSIQLYSTIIETFKNNMLHNNTADVLQRGHLKQLTPNTRKSVHLMENLSLQHIFY